MRNLKRTERLRSSIRKHRKLRAQDGTPEIRKSAMQSPETRSRWTRFREWWCLRGLELADWGQVAGFIALAVSLLALLCGFPFRLW